MILIKYLEIILFIYFGLMVIHTFILSMGGLLFYKDRSGNTLEPQEKIAIIIPAYKEDGIILNSLKEHLTLNYPKELYHVFLCADSFAPETIQKIKELPVTVFEISFEVSSVVNSVKYGVSQLNPAEYPITLICDADNVLAKDFLTIVNSAFQNGIRAMQGRRFTKNVNTPMAILDSISEAINNHIFRKGNYSIGFSSALIGSGMAFETALIKDCLMNRVIISLGGYDRDLQLYLSDKDVRIHYVESAVCLDEKISNIKAFGNQRRRWINSQFLDLSYHFKDSFDRLFRRGDLNYFNLAFIMNIFFSRLLNLGFLFSFSCLSILLFLIFHNPELLPPIDWILLFIVYGICLIVGIPKKFVNKDLWSAILYIPKSFLTMFIMLFRQKDVNKKFIHTEHTVIEVSEDILDKK